LKRLCEKRRITREADSDSASDSDTSTSSEKADGDEPAAPDTSSVSIEDTRVMLERAVRRAAEVEDEMAATEAMLRTVEQRADQLQEEKDALCKLVKHLVTASMGPIIVGVDQLSCMSVGEIESLLEHSMP
jgi:hypothetical protein